MTRKKNFFTCKSCGLEQNLDQSVHIKQKYCVSCYNKEQVFREMMMIHQIPQRKEKIHQNPPKKSSRFN